MTRCIMITDTHLGLYKSSETYHNVVKNLFKEVVDNCIRENIDTIIHLGDWFDERKYINTLTLNASSDIEDMLDKIKLVIVAGNHDTYYKNQIIPTSLKVFKHCKNITVLDYPCMLGDFIILPWKMDLPEYLEKGGKWLLGHFEVNDISLSAKYTTKKFEREISDFKKFEKVFSGHFHTPITKDNITYLGAPFQQDFGDSGGTRGYYIFEDGNLEFISFTNYPKFVIIDTETKINSEMIKGNIIKLKFLKDYGMTENTKIIENIQSFEPLEFYSDFAGISVTQDIMIEDAETTEVKDNKDIFFEYIDKSEIAPHLNKETMKKIVSNLMEKK